MNWIENLVKLAILVILFSLGVSACGDDSVDNPLGDESHSTPYQPGPTGMTCARGHDEVKTGIGDEGSTVHFVCDEYVPDPDYTPEAEPKPSSSLTPEPR